LLTDFIASTQNEDLRSRAFDSALRFLSSTESASNADTTRDHWTQLSAQAKTGNEQMKIVRGLANFDADWAVKLIEGYKDSDDDRTADLAEKALERIREIRRLKGDGESEPETPQEE
jgi:hypothetical protein